MRVRTNFIMRKKRVRMEEIMENAKKYRNEEVTDYQPKLPEIIHLTESICSMKIVEKLQQAGAEYMFVEREAFHMVGRRCVTPDGGGAWGVARGDGTMETMMELQTGNPFCGLCFGFFEDGSNDNMVAIEYGDNVEGLDSFDYPAHKWLVYVLSGKTSEDLLGNAWWYINNKLLDELGIQKDALPTMEAYVEWDTENDKGSVEICIPYIDK